MCAASLIALVVSAIPAAAFWFGVFPHFAFGAAAAK
jgi:hypothetical protein